MKKHWNQFGWAIPVLMGVLVFSDPVSAALSEAFQTVISADADPSVMNPTGLTEFRSSNGVLALDISATYDSNNSNGAVFPTPADGSSPPFYRLAYSCKYTHSNAVPVISYAGPFLRVHPGDHVIINFTNDLKIERTNIHFHGLGITPKIGTSEGLDYGDYVGLPYVNFVDPGAYRQFDFYIPREQRQGLYWYHSHAHGVSEYQVGTGLSGPLLVEGEIQTFLSNWSAKVTKLLGSKDAKPLIKEVAGALPKLPYYVLSLKDFTYPGDTNGISGPFEQTVNGKVTYTANNPGASTPFWITSGGTKQVWSIANIGADTYYNLNFQVVSNNVTNNLPFEIISLDGGPDNMENPALNAPETNLLLHPGARATVIVPTDVLGTNVATIIAQPVTTALGSLSAYTSTSGDSYFQPTNSPLANGNERSSAWDIIEVHPTNTTSYTGSNQMPSIINLPQAQSLLPRPYLQGSQINATYVLSQPWLYFTDSNNLPLENLGALTFYKYVSNADGGPSRVKNPISPYDFYEPAIATLVPGVPQNWIIQNTTQE